MGQVRVSESIPASADKVWRLIGDFGSLPRWLPAIAASPVAGEGVGAVRTLAFVGSQAYAKERLDAHDDAARTYTYSVVETDIPLASYSAAIRIEPTGTAICRLHWTSEFSATGEGSEAELSAMIEQTYREGIARIAELVSR